MGQPTDVPVSRVIVVCLPYPVVVLDRENRSNIETRYLFAMTVVCDARDLRFDAKWRAQGSRAKGVTEESNLTGFGVGLILAGLFT